MSAAQTAAAFAMAAANRHKTRTVTPALISIEMQKGLSQADAKGRMSLYRSDRYGSFIFCTSPSNRGSPCRGVNAGSVLSIGIIALCAA